MSAGRFSLLLVVAALLPACGGSSTPSEWPKGHVVLKDANNYTSDTTLTIPIVQAKAGADLTVCWDGIMKDLLCHDLVAGTEDIDNVGFLQVPLSKDVVSQKLAVGQLSENQVSIYREHRVAAGETCANLSTFAFGSTLNPATDFVEPTGGKTLTYMLLFATGLTPGVGSRAMVFVDPSASSTTMKVDAPDACANHVLDFQATLGQPMMIPATDSTKWHVDWSQISKDSFGNPVNFAKLDDVLLGFYRGMSAADLQTQFTDIELIATTLYDVSVPAGARDVDLATAKVRGGTDSFPGFTQTDGVWAIAVRCTSCQIPAPIVMTILQ